MIILGYLQCDIENNEGVKSYNCVNFSEKYFLLPLKHFFFFFSNVWDAKCVFLN